jgi:hypothetical protein
MGPENPKQLKSLTFAHGSLTWRNRSMRLGLRLRCFSAVMTRAARLTRSTPHAYNEVC